MAVAARWASRVSAIAGADLLRRFRNRSLVVTAFVAPVLLAVVLGWILGGVSERTYKIGVVDNDGSAASRTVLDTLLDPSNDTTASAEAGIPAGDAVEFERVGSSGTAGDRVSDNDLSAAIVIPSGYERSGAAVPLVVLRSPRRMVSGQVAESVAIAISDRAQRRAIAGATAERLGVDPAAPSTTAAAQATPLPVRLESTAAAASTVAYFGASMCIVFLFFTVGYAARSVMIDRENGMLARLLSTPTSLTAVIAGKCLSVASLGAVGFVGVWAVTAVVFGAEWGRAIPVLVLIVSTVVAIAGLSLLVSSLGKTERQADGYATIVAFVLALVGGNFIPIGSATEGFRRLSMLTPNGWSLRGFTEVSSGATLATVATPAAVLVGLGCAAGFVGFVRVHRSVIR